MITAARRGHASIARCLRLPPSTFPTTSNLALLSWKNTNPIARLPSTPASRAFSIASQWKQEAAVQSQEYQRTGNSTGGQSSQNPPQSKAQYGPVTKFAELGERNMVCPSIVDRITRDMKLETMTHVQSLTINETLKGIDVLAQARTGTGKTLAFIIPVLQNIISVDPSLEFPSSSRRPRTGQGSSSPLLDIRALIISPTRELAEQIAVEARKVTRGTGVIVQTAVGGTMKREGMYRIKSEGCHILVGTPGRLHDVLSDPYSGITAPNLSALVLDEADRLLDQGFSQAIEDIQQHLPKRSQRDRQTLLFSATIPREVMHMVRRIMKPDFTFVRTVKEGEQETHMKVPQMLTFARGFENLMPALVELCKREQQKAKEQNFKAIVYFGATSEVALAATTFSYLIQSGGGASFGGNPFGSTSIIEMHSKLSQQQRTRAADAFRRSKSGILLSSDVTARGMDFPNVTHVIQVGIPQSKDTYVHRIGRTARGDKGGEGWLLLTDLEKYEARSRLRDLPLVLDASLETIRIDMSQDAQLSASAAETLTQTINASKMVPRPVKAAAYLANIGMYSWASDKGRLIESLNARARYCWGMDTPPSISASLAHKLGYVGVPGVEIGRNFDSDRDQGYPGPQFELSASGRVSRGESFGGSSRGGSFGGSSRGGSFGGSSRGGSFGGSSRGGSFGDPSRGGSFGGSSRGGSFGGRDGGFSRERGNNSGGFQRSPWESRGRQGGGGFSRDRGSFNRDRSGDRSGRGHQIGGASGF